MKRFLTLALACCLAFTVVGCDVFGKKEPKGKIKLNADSGSSQSRKGDVKGLPSPVGGGVVTDSGLD